MTERMRLRRIVFLVAVICLFGLTILLLRRPDHIPSHIFEEGKSILEGHHAHESNEPVPAPNAQSHPIHKLISTAEEEFEKLKSRQSRSLKDAVAEYRKRYKMPPPPNFDKWYEFATKNSVVLMDEYDLIYHSLLPFWGAEPSVLRERTREAIGFDNAMIATIIRDGKIVQVEGGGDGAEWHRNATKKDARLVRSILTRHGSCIQRAR